jgi:hypothetical protein
VARDAGNNVVTSFSGAGSTAVVTSNGTLQAGGERQARSPTVFSTPGR